MTESRTLQFESPRALQSLYANDIKLLKNLEDSLGVKITTREGWVKLEGDPSRVDKAQQVFQQLEQARQRGVDRERLGLQRDERTRAQHQHTVCPDDRARGARRRMDR